MNILLDSNVILDLALKRKPYIESIRPILQKADENQFYFYITSASITDIHYVISKEIGKTKSLKFLKDLVSKVELCISDKQIIQNALQSNFKDFEDAVQYYAALSSNLEVIITRNKKDFKLAKNIQIMTPNEFVNKYIDTELKTENNSE